MTRQFWSALVAALALTAPVHAQDEPERTRSPDEPELLRAIDLIVTATGHEASAFEVPTSTARIGRDEFERTRARRTLTDALLDLPSVMVQRTGYGQASPFIRGFTGYQTVMLVDGIRLNNSTFRSGPNQYWSTIDSFTVERLELTRGASSVLHGSDAVGGAVNAVGRRRISFEPGTHVGGRTHARWSSAERSWILRGEVEGNVDDLGFLVGATSKTFSDLTVADVSGRLPETGYRETNGDVRLDFRADPDTMLTFAVQHVDQDAVPRVHKTVDAVPFEGTSVGSELRRDLFQTRDLVYGRVDRRRLGLSFADRAVVTLSYHRQREKRIRDRDRGRRDVQGFEVETLGLQAQFEKSTSVGYFTYGVEAWLDDVTSFRKDFTGGVQTLSRVQGPVADDANYELFGLYLQDEIDVGTATITAGVRYTRAAADADRVDNPLVGGGDPSTPGNVISVDDSWNNLVGSLRAVQPLSDEWNLFGGVSQAFRAPNLSDLTRLDDTSGLETPSPGLDEETFLNYEIGVKGRSERWSAQAAYWRTEISDLIVPSPTGRLIGGTPEIRKDNVGDGAVHGVELEGAFHLSDAWTVSAAHSWMDGEVEQIDPVRGVVDAPLSRLMPRTTVLTLTYAPPAKPLQAWMSTRLVQRQGDLSLKDVTDTSRIPKGGTPGYQVLSLGLGLELNEHLHISAVIDNLTDEAYRIHGSGINEPGRNFVVAVDLKF